MAFPNGVLADYNSFEINQSQGAESVAAYGAAISDPWRGSGTPHIMISGTAFQKGHAALTGFMISTQGSGLSDPDGATSTFTVDTGHTVAAPFVVTDFRLSHARLRAAIPVNYTIHQSADETVTWAST